ncbi:MAG: hypothetical protein NZO16_07620, partial [Deltaproteobacteria bacterium]|nr:hypothetical protein [Deltaproteobacteria bacterium]
KFSDELFADKELENLDTPLQVEGNFELEPDDSRSFELDSTGGEESEFTSHRFAEESEDLSSMTKTFEKTDGNFFQLENDPLEDDLTAAFSEENIAKVQTEKSLENLVSVDLGASKILGNTLDESNFFGEIANHLLPQDSIKDPVGKLEPTTREVANDATEVIQPLKKRDNLSNFNSIVALSQPKQERVESTSLSVLILAVMAALLGVINLYLFIGAQLNEETLPKVVVSVDSESKDTTSKPSRQKKKNGMEISEAKFELANSEAVVAFSIKKIAKKSLLFEMSLKDYPLTDNERKFENVQTGTNLTWIENLSSAVVVDLPKNVMDELNFSTSGRLMIKDPRILRRLLATVSVSFIDKTLRLNVTSDTFTTHRVFNLSDSDWEKIIQLLK